MNKSRMSVLVKALLFAALTVGCFMVLIPGLAMKFDTYIKITLPEYFSVVGYITFVLSAILSYTSWRLFITQGKRTAFPTDPPKKLIILGLYRFVRNPMYIGNLCMIFSEALIFKSPSIFIYFLVAFVLVHIYIIHEEKLLEKRFGTDYINYIKNVPRWIPSLKVKYSPN